MSKTKLEMSPNTHPNIANPTNSSEVLIATSGVQIIDFEGEDFINAAIDLLYRIQKTSHMH